MDKKAIRENMSELHAQLTEIEDRERREAHDKLVGQCFVYRNCYSCPQGPEDYWRLYTKVVGLTEHGNLKLFRFQTDCNGKITVETDITGGTASIGTPITDSVFDDAKENLFNTLHIVLTPS